MDHFGFNFGERTGRLVCSCLSYHGCKETSIWLCSANQPWSKHMQIILPLKCELEMKNIFFKKKEAGKFHNPLQYLAISEELARSSPPPTVLYLSCAATAVKDNAQPRSIKLDKLWMGWGESQGRGRAASALQATCLNQEIWKTESNSRGECEDRNQCDDRPFLQKPFPQDVGGWFDISKILSCAQWLHQKQRDQRQERDWADLDHRSLALRSALVLLNSLHVPLNQSNHPHPPFCSTFSLSRQRLRPFPNQTGSQRGCDALFLSLPHPATEPHP